MSTAFRNSIVAVAALLLILGPLGWAVQFQQSFRAKYAKLARDSEIAKGNAAAANLSDAEILSNGFGAEMSSEEATSLWLSDVLLTFWWFWGLFVLAICYGLFVILGSIRTVAHRTDPSMSSSPGAVP